MGIVRGLRTRLCPKCSEITPHRTLYVRATSNGKRRWFQLFWACTECASLNHIVLPAYRLEHVSLPLPRGLALGVVDALEEGGELDLDELIMKLRERTIPGVRHVFNTEVGLALEFLKGAGVIAEGTGDRTVKVLGLLKARPAETSRTGHCPARSNHGITEGALVSLYAQTGTNPSGKTRLVPIGVFCPQCRFSSVGKGNHSGLG